MFLDGESVPSVAGAVRKRAGQMVSAVLAKPKARLWVQFAAHNEERFCGVTAPALAMVEERLAELRALAEEENSPYSEASESDLRQFLAAAGAVARPATYLLDDGCLRVKWRNLHGEQVGLQFAGNDFVQMVFFVQRPTGAIARIVGQDTLDGALGQIRSLGLRALLTA
jgi:hypothetical protein